MTAPIDGGHNFCGFGDMKGYNKMILTDFKPSHATGILKSGVCIKSCPQEKDKEFKDGVDCKSNSKVKCDKRKSYITRDAFDFCLPVSKDALEKDEQAGYKLFKDWLSNSPIGTIYEDMYKSSTSI